MQKRIDDPDDGSLVICISFLLFFSQGCLWVMVSEFSGMEREFFSWVRSRGNAAWWCRCQMVYEDQG